LITGPFSILLGFEGGIMALNDRLKLRSMVVAEKGDRFYAASEEAAIRRMEPQPDKIWAPSGGEPVIARLAGSADGTSQAGAAGPADGTSPADGAEGGGKHGY
jgi:glutamate synthase domain-containing protein 1